MPTRAKKKGATKRPARGRVVRAKLNGQPSTRSRMETSGPAAAAAGALSAVTVAAKELKDSAVEAGRKVNLRKAAPVAAAVTAVVATGLLWRRKKK